MGEADEASAGILLGRAARLTEWMLLMKIDGQTLIRLKSEPKGGGLSSALENCSGHFVPA